MLARPPCSIIAADVVAWWRSLRRRWAHASALDMPAAGDRWQEPHTLRILDVVHVGSGQRGLRIVGALDSAPRAWAYEDFRAQVTGWHLLRRAGREVTP